MEPAQNEKDADKDTGKGENLFANFWIAEEEAFTEK